MGTVPEILQSGNKGQSPNARPAGERMHGAHATPRREPSPHSRFAGDVDGERERDDANVERGAHSASVEAVEA